MFIFRSIKLRICVHFKLKRDIRFNLNLKINFKSTGVPYKQLNLVVYTFRRNGPRERRPKRKDMNAPNPSDPVEMRRMNYQTPGKYMYTNKFKTFCLNVLNKKSDRHILQEIEKLPE